MGLHVFYPEWQGSGRVLSSSFREVTLKIYGTSEQITFPCQVSVQVRAPLASQRPAVKLPLFFTRGALLNGILYF